MRDSGQAAKDQPAKVCPFLFHQATAWAWKPRSLHMNARRHDQAGKSRGGVFPPAPRGTPGLKSQQHTTPPSSRGSMLGTRQSFPREICWLGGIKTRALNRRFLSTRATGSVAVTESGCGSPVGNPGANVRETPRQAYVLTARDDLAARHGMRGPVLFYQTLQEQFFFFIVAVLRDFAGAGASCRESVSDAPERPSDKGPQSPKEVTGGAPGQQWREHRNRYEKNTSRIYRTSFLSTLGSP